MEVATMENGMRATAHRHLGAISDLADKAPWGPRDFAAARAMMEKISPSAEMLWKLLGGD